MSALHAEAGHLESTEKPPTLCLTRHNVAHNVTDTDTDTDWALHLEHALQYLDD